jgi:hypothetical protein
MCCSRRARRRVGEPADAPELDRDGAVRLGTNGERVYQPVNEWRTRRLREAFSARVVSLVRQAFPADLER